jgi:hypothetical protein
MTNDRATKSTQHGKEPKERLQAQQTRRRRRTVRCSKHTARQAQRNNNTRTTASLHSSSFSANECTDAGAAGQPRLVTDGAAAAALLGSVRTHTSFRNKNAVASDMDSWETRGRSNAPRNPVAALDATVGARINAVPAATVCTTVKLLLTPAVSGPALTSSSGRPSKRAQCGAHLQNARQPSCNHMQTPPTTRAEQRTCCASSSRRACSSTPREDLASQTQHA